MFERSDYDGSPIFVLLLTEFMGVVKMILVGENLGHSRKVIHELSALHPKAP